MLCGAYTRNRNDWLELVAGLDASMKRIPARNVILDGELHGTVFDSSRAAPAPARCTTSTARSRGMAGTR